MRSWLLSILLAMAAAWHPVRAAEDPGRAVIGMVEVTVFHATNQDPRAAGARAKTVPKVIRERLASEERLRFQHYRQIGQDAQPLLRSYENWAQPLKPSDEILVCFEAKGRPVKAAAMVDVDLWLARKKIVSTVAKLEADRPLFLLGPEWRGGRLIIGVALAPKPPSTPSSPPK